MKLKSLATKAAATLAAATMSLGLGAGAANAVNGGTIPTGDTRSAAVAKINAAGLCSGTLIAEQWVLTAAHCIKYLPSGTVGFGIDGKTEERSFNNTFRHSSNNIDVGLILLDEPITTITPMKVDANPDRLAVGQMGVGMGWGGDAKKEGNLRATPVEMIGVMEDRFNINLLTRSLLLEGKTPPGGALTQGDSGGPLFMNDDPTSIVGVFSYTQGNKLDQPLHSPVSLAQPWITQIMDSHSAPTFIGSVEGYGGSVESGLRDIISGELFKFIS